MDFRVIIGQFILQAVSSRPANSERVTLVHGDFKGANYFLKNEGIQRLLVPGFCGFCGVFWVDLLEIVGVSWPCYVFSNLALLCFLMFCWILLTLVRLCLLGILEICSFF